MRPKGRSGALLASRTRGGAEVCLALAACLAGLCGCATPTLEHRRAERAEAYAALSPEARARVDAGEIAEGMDTNAVFIAWGRPTKVAPRAGDDRSELEWRYYRSYARPRRVLYTSYDGRGYPKLDSYYDSTAGRYLARRVVFRQGRVAWFDTYAPLVP